MPEPRKEYCRAVLKAGRSPSAQKAARSHTAALTGDEAVWKAIFEQYGIIQLEDIDDIIGVGQLFGASPRTNGSSAAILTTSGGAGIVMADSLNDLKMSVPEFSVTVKRDRGSDSDFGGVSNLWI